MGVGRDLSDLLLLWCGVVFVSSGLVSGLGGGERVDTGRLEGGKDWEISGKEREDCEVGGGASIWLRSYV